MVFLRKPNKQDIKEIKLAYQQSESIHRPWVHPPENYESYLNQEGRYFVCFKGSEKIVGTFHISGIVRSYFQSAYLGYEVFSPYQGEGYMKGGLKLLLTEAFTNLNLHRLEANVQPENKASIRLVSAAGFVKEGFSRQYLRVGGEWKDHERWAIVNEDWMG